MSEPMYVIFCDGLFFGDVDESGEDNIVPFIDLPDAVVHKKDMEANGCKGVKIFRCEEYLGYLNEDGN